LNLSLILFWFASFLSLIGAYYVAEHKRIGFLVWCLSNPLIIIQTYLSNSWNLVFLYIVFWILAVRGYTKKPTPQKGYNVTTDVINDTLNVDWKKN
jgi:uncharacterized membrane protein